MVRGENDEHPGARAAAAADLGADIDLETVVQLEAADALRLEDAEETGAVKIVDRAV